jgi:LysR family transcriptional regulator, transcriptional activator of the cysJI operon
MTFHQLRIFKAVAQHLNVTHAANELHVSQPCVSTQLKLLENEFGVQFYAKHRQGIKLTKEGLLFLRRIRPIVQQAEELQKLFAIRAGRERIVLEIASTQNAAVGLLNGILTDFRKGHPNVNLALRSAQSRVVEQMVINDEVEIGIITNPSYNPQLITRPFSSEEVVAVVSSKHPLARKSELSNRELSTTPTLVRMGGIILKELQQAGLKLNVSMECESSEPLKTAVESGLGLGFFYRSTVEGSLQSGRLKSIRISGLKEITIKSVIVYLKNKKLSLPAREFITLLYQCTPKSEKVSAELHGVI